MHKTRPFCRIKSCLSLEVSVGHNHIPTNGVPVDEAMRRNDSRGREASCIIISGASLLPAARLQVVPVVQWWHSWFRATLETHELYDQAVQDFTSC
ncbi:hypothetical protein PBY51_005561 [Eleginops maclovinus]|uniref:Uncharacterized protein n=1 Tax=Eleginops maclovinus TaxID=56733 RepID=A0AAN7X9G8_ELEMC|nr:hypothetical protein PBY51_005561 [Eleginops maclovinus]